MDEQESKPAAAGEERSQQPQTAKFCVEVVAGLIPGKDPDPEFTRRWWISSEEWEAAGEKGGELLAETNGRALGYAGLLMLQPGRLNWVRTDWILF